MILTTITTLVIFKQANTVEKTPVYPNPDRVVASHKEFEISAKGQVQIKDLADQLGVYTFEALATSPQSRAVKTITPIYEKIKEKNANITLTKINEWEEVNMGDLDGLTPNDIKNLYLKHFPTEKAPADFNDCMNKKWPVIDEKEYHFETYPEFGKRIKNATEKTVKLFAGKTVGLCTHTEDIRNLVMDSVGTPEFLGTEFGKDILNKLQVKNGDNFKVEDIYQRTLGELGLVRADFKPDDASWMRITVGNDGVLRLHENHRFIVR